MVLCVLDGGAVGVNRRSWSVGGGGARSGDCQRRKQVRGECVSGGRGVPGRKALVRCFEG